VPSAGVASKAVFFGADFCRFPLAARADAALRRAAQDRRMEGRMRKMIAITALAGALLMTAGIAQAFDETKYPNLKGQWVRNDLGGQRGGLRFDSSKPPGKGQQAPLTPEYQAIFEANLADQAAGGQGTDPTFTCLSPGMPRIMIGYAPMEVVVTPETTYILMEHIHDNRRIHTDGRDWPEEADPMFAGYSIGKWVDEDGDGRYDLLVVETRNLKNPRSYDASGIPFHEDGKTVIKERIYLDKANPNLLHDEITTIDNALTRPWVVKKSYRRVVTDKPIWWREDICVEGNNHVRIGGENYYFSGEGLLMPAKKNQTPPDLRYFKQSAK
jgi:hypothetical protein